MEKMGSFCDASFFVPWLIITYYQSRLIFQ